MSATILSACLLLGAQARWNAEPSVAVIRGEMESRGIPGLAAAVIREGRVVWSGTFGLADVENAVPVTPRTIFRFASVSKPITAVAALRMVEAGRLALDQPISAVVRGLPADMSKVTVRHLLAHQSGLRHYQPDPREGLPHFTYLPDAVRSRAADARLFEPGARFSYSTHGYSVLGWSMEMAAGRSFAEEIRAQVFEPAGMTTARTDDLYAIIPHRAQGYFRSLGGELRNSRPMDPSDKLPGGGLCGTILDLAAFAAALQSDRLLRTNTREMMWTAQRLADGLSTDYGLGWHLGERDGRRYVFHSGSQPRSSSFIYLEPDRGLAVVLLGNLEQVDFLPLVRRLLRVGDVTVSAGARPRSPRWRATR